MIRVVAALAAVIVAAFLVLGFYLSDKIYLRDNHATITPRDFEVRHGPAAVRADAAFLVDTLRKIHPAFHDIGGEEYAAAVMEVASGADAPMTRSEVYRALAPLNGRLQDGHTYLREPAEERAAYEAAGGRYPPFTISFAPNGLIIDQPLAGNGQFQAGDKITSVNGVTAEIATAFALDSDSGESIALRTAYASRNFHRHLWAMGVTSPFDIEVVRNGETITARHEGVTVQEMREHGNSQTRENSFEILNNGVGLLTFSDMPAPDSEFRSFLAESFAAVRAAGADDMIIDLRNNGGGDSRAGDLLMSYLTTHKLPSVAYVDVKVTDEIKRYYRTLLPDGFRWLPLHQAIPMLRQIQNTAPGESFRFHPDAARPKPRRKTPEDAFAGNLYVLIGPRTYSSAVIFAAPLKHFGRATFVGEETGEPLIFYGENYYFDLPNTRLQTQVSHKTFALVGATNPGVGIRPDIPSSDALPSAVNAILNDR